MINRKVIKFGDICHEVKLTTKDPVAEGYERYIGLEHLDSGSLKINRWGVIADDNPSFTKVFKKGNILFGRRRAYLKKAAIAEFDGICSGDIIVIKPRTNTKFCKLLPHIVQSELFWNWAIKNSAGGLSPRTKFKNLADFTFYDKTDTEIQCLERKIACIEKVQRDFLELDSSTSSLFLTLVNSLTRFGTKHEILKKTPVGMIPTSWDICQFKDLLACDTKNGLYKGQDYYGAGLKMVHMGDMFHSSKITENSVEQSVNVNNKEVKTFGVIKGDLLFARRSLVKEGAGLCCIFDGNDYSATFESSIIRARLDPEKANPSYFNYFFRSDYGRWLMERIVQTVAASGITGTDLKKMLVPVPSKNEQDKIVNILDEISKVNLQKINNRYSYNNILNCLVSELVESTEC
ncbi:restriction endonuclease subunit S [Citrobacter sp. RHB20-C16]|uniref:restriction endonuclease subunit S n=1 Tax=unclassified Citrobacter TaxID=2644389 RepID=UPI0015E99C93|nr:MULTISPECIES: restriction endonuclease subunit S [unclassified Citrobacter]QMK79907.1 restriction endonuclease subunit S [Citrobacter sp. RHB20-C16]QMK84522.1 restriction endonuclease subunit S [Citrobacter sp. RHB20-C15]